MEAGVAPCHLLSPRTLARKFSGPDMASKAEMYTCGLQGRRKLMANKKHRMGRGREKRGGRMWHKGLRGGCCLKWTQEEWRQGT